MKTQTTKQYNQNGNHQNIKIIKNSDNWIIKACERLSIIDYW